MLRVGGFCPLQPNRFIAKTLLYRVESISAILTIKKWPLNAKISTQTPQIYP